MEVKNVSIDSIKPYKNNPRDNEAGVDAVANSIKEFKWQQPIVVDKDNIIIVGHTRLLAAKKLKLKQVPVVVADSLTPEQVKAYRLADNKTNELTDWDDDLLEEELNSILDIDMTDFGFGNEEEIKTRQFDDVYSQNVKSIEYEPHGEKPEIQELVNDSKYIEMVEKIKSEDLPKELEKFMVYSSSRFLEFDFAKIAEFYAQSDEKIQKIMEDQLLVIVDYDQAIQKSIMKFNEEIRQQELDQAGELDERLK